MFARRPRVLATAGVMLLVVAAGMGWASHPGTAARASSNVPTASAAVRRTDVIQRQTFAGSIGFAGAYTIVSPGDGAAGGLSPAQAQAAVNTALMALAADRTALADTAAVGAATDSQAAAAVNSAQAMVNADQAQPATLQHDQAELTAAQASLRLTLARDRQANHQAQSRVDADSSALSNARTASAGNAGPRIFTRLPVVGDEVKRGEPLFEVDNHGVPLFLGERPLSRRLALGVSAGPDVRELKDNLVALGFAPVGGDLGPDGVFDAATAAAVVRWEASLGVAQTAVVEPPDVVFAASALRITALHVMAGAPVQGGTPLLDATSTTAVVNVPLDATNEGVVRAGDRVIVNLPSDTTTAGIVTAVGRVATPASSSNQGGQSGPPHATVDVTVALSDPAASGGLDQAPVTVGITSQQHNGVLAVPINALLALEEGGYAVKLVSGGRGLVAVRTGLFSDDGMVEVSGQIHEGDRVEVPKS